MNRNICAKETALSQVLQSLSWDHLNCELVKKQKEYLVKHTQIMLFVAMLDITTYKI